MAYELNKYLYENLKVNYNTQTIDLSELKEEFPEYKNIFSQVVMNVADRLDKSSNSFFSRVRKRKNQRDTYEIF